MQRYVSERRRKKKHLDVACYAGYQKHYALVGLAETHKWEQNSEPSGIRSSRLQILRTALRVVEWVTLLRLLFGV